ncbi:hypothetical protein NIES2119_29595 [[Phormidium ambiguum] IAM M-71]|uniref:PLD phosphodiesterase domain-containing protein n=1 Tax=[Phormidium ambiguum] IAM M-71 TaxID=454136 RepID=A0A1U7I4J5_9CYAN|nr:hypothetical protein [Phormidium ambiguum]OKH31125.1 hypothetical protein NIES2119_29595 [Phormidium ambiguum IAM M-71]
MNLDIELIPSVEHSSIKTRLETSLNKCQNVKGAVAYWTIDTAFVTGLAEVLQREDSYYCIDIHKPTNIDYLAEFKKLDSNIFLHDYELKSNSQNYELEMQQKNPYLLHSKMILFELPDYKVEIWVGSHNFTQRAIRGVNIESSIIIRTNQNSKIYSDVLKYLTFIKDNCIPFDLKDVDFYKLLQGEYEEDTGSWVLELVGENAANLVDEKMIQLLGVDSKDLIDRLGQEIIIQILNLDDEKEYIYKAEVLQAGEMNLQNSKSFGITFSPRRYAVRGTDKIPYLRKEQEISQTLLQEHNYYINLEIIEPLIDYKVYYKPIRSKYNWTEITDPPHLLRMNQEDRDLLFQKQSKPIKRSDKKPIQLTEFSLKTISQSSRKQLKSYYGSPSNNLLALPGSFDETPKEIQRKRILTKRIVKPANKD